MNGLENKKDSENGKFIPYLTQEENAYVYVLPGIPIPLPVHQHGNGHTWDPQKQKKLITSITIGSLHGTRPKYTGPLHLDIRFYFPLPQRGKNFKTTWQYKPHSIKPNISYCVNYIENVCNTMLYDDDCLISSVYSQKLYDYEPRTEFYIVELK